LLFEHLPTPSRFASLTPELWSITDQGLLSGSNFVLSLICARLLPVADYGIFAAGFAFFLLIAGFHNALVLEPMCVKAPGQSALPGNAYLGVMELHHVLGTALLIVPILAFIVVASMLQPALACALTCTLWSAPVVLYHWLMRRSCYIWSSPRSAAISSAVYSAALGLSATGLFAIGVRSYLTPFLAAAAASAVASVAIRWSLRPHLPGAGALGSNSRLVWTSHWSYSKWILPVAALYWVSDAAFPAILLLTAGPAGSAYYRAADNLFMPLVQSLASLCLLNLPRLSQAASRRPGQLRAFAVRAAAGSLILGSAYSAAIIAFSPGLIRLLYSGEDYATIGQVVPWLALAVVVRGTCDLSLSTPIRALGESKSIFVSVLAGSILTCLAGMILMTRFGWTGAVATRAITVIVQAGILIFLFRSSLRAAANGPTLAPGPAGISGQRS
jgi:O-antigen/teichoic acid export membrane protein